MGKQVVSLVKQFSNKFFQCLQSSPPASTRSLQLPFVSKVHVTGKLALYTGTKRKLNIFNIMHRLFLFIDAWLQASFTVKSITSQWVHILKS